MLLQRIGLLVLCFGIATGVAAQGVNTEAPDFVGQTPEGETIRLSDFRGQVVLLDFWASWCGPCREEMPFLIELYQEYQDEAFVLLAINVDTEQESMQAFLTDLGLDIPFTLIADKDATIPPLYDLEGMPTTVFIDAEGTVRFVHTGFRAKDQAQYRAELQSLLAENN